MSSRVQKGSTVFRPVAKARSRAPTTPVQSQPTTQELHVIPESTPAPSETPQVSPPISLTTIPRRETATQLASPPQPEPVSFLPTPPQTLVREPPTLAHALSIPPPSRQQHAPVLANASNLPPSLFTVGRSPSQGNAITVPSRQDMHPPAFQPQMSHMPFPTPPATFIPPAGSFYVGDTNSFVQVPVHGHVNQIHPSQPPSTLVSTGQPKRRRKASKVSSDGEDEDTSTAKKSKSRSTTPRQRRSRGPSAPPYDPNADPGENIDPTTVTMATLCSDIGQGRVSSKAAEIVSNHVAWKQRNRERRMRMRELMEAKKYGRTVDEDTEHTDPPSSDPLAETEARTGVSLAGPSTGDADDENEIYNQNLETSRYNVQVRIGPNGETIIDEDSLTVDRADNTEDMTGYTHVTESDHTKFTNSGTYGKRYRGSRWSAEETELFYNALSQYGENYELIAYVLPGRDRKSCKNKFKAEDKKNHARINYCLNNKIPVDMKTLERMTGKDFSGPCPEIRAPPPPPTIEVEPTEEPVVEIPAKPVKKRSRSRTSGFEDGVTIVGDVDSVMP